MTGQGRWRRWLGGLALASLLWGPGCLSFINPVDPAPKDDLTACKEIPEYCRNRVYVFFYQGFDPVNLCNLEGVRDYVQSLGFIKTWYGFFWHGEHFAEKIIEIHKEEPDARFVLVGFSFGANAARRTANQVAKEHIPIDLIVYFGANTFENTPDTKPDNVMKVVNILAVGAIWHGAQLDGAENIKYDSCWHFGSPAHPDSTNLLTRELAVVARRVPLIFVPPEALLNPSPTPRPIKEVPQMVPHPVLPPPTPQGQQAKQDKREKMGRGQVGRGSQAKQEQAPQKPPPARPKDDWDFLHVDDATARRSKMVSPQAPLAPVPKEEDREEHADGSK
jgi:hypothetical protein